MKGTGFYSNRRVLHWGEIGGTGDYIPYRDGPQGPHIPGRLQVGKHHYDPMFAAFSWPHALYHYFTGKGRYRGNRLTGTGHYLNDPLYARWHSRRVKAHFARQTGIDHRVLGGLGSYLPLVRRTPRTPMFRTPRVTPGSTPTPKNMINVPLPATIANTVGKILWKPKPWFKSFKDFSPALAGLVGLVVGGIGGWQLLGDKEKEPVKTTVTLVDGTVVTGIYF